MPISVIIYSSKFLAITFLGSMLFSNYSCFSCEMQGLQQFEAIACLLWDQHSISGSLKIRRLRLKWKSPNNYDFRSNLWTKQIYEALRFQFSNITTYYLHLFISFLVILSLWTFIEAEQKQSRNKDLLPQNRRFHAESSISITFQGSSFQSIQSANYLLHIDSLVQCWK